MLVAGLVVASVFLAWVEVDDCTFWYVSEYYQTSSAVGWQTRVGSFRLPGCVG